MSRSESRMVREFAEVPGVLARQRAETGARLETLGAELRALAPPVIVTIGRGSSDHAALYLKYVAELLLGLPCASIGPSVASLYGAKLRLPGAVAVAISQSGQSPDLLALRRSVAAAGALDIALVNDPDSPLAREAARCVPLCAGVEHSVAATKTMLAALALAASLLAAWAEDGELLEAIDALPDRLAAILATRPEDRLAALATMDSAYVIGRGPMLAAAAEAALKLKETCAVHAEAFSAAEVLHGPSAVIAEDFPVIAFLASDEARPSTLQTLDRLGDLGARCIVYDAAEIEPPAGHPLLSPLAMILAFYADVERLAHRRGRDPDNPPALAKVTRTL